jgi:hypothetical protein
MSEAPPRMSNSLVHRSATMPNMHVAPTKETHNTEVNSADEAKDEIPEQNTVDKEVTDRLNSLRDSFEWALFPEKQRNGESINAREQHTRDVKLRHLEICRARKQKQEVAINEHTLVGRKATDTTVILPSEDVPSPSEWIGNVPSNSRTSSMYRRASQMSQLSRMVSRQASFGRVLDYQDDSTQYSPDDKTVGTPDVVNAFPMPPQISPTRTVAQEPEDHDTIAEDTAGHSFTDSATAEPAVQVPEFSEEQSGYISDLTARMSAKLRAYERKMNLLEAALLAVINVTASLDSEVARREGVNKSTKPGSVVLDALMQALSERSEGS